MSYKDEICEKLKDMEYKVDKALRNSIRPQTGAIILDLIEKVENGSVNITENELTPLEQRVLDSVDNDRDVKKIIESLGYDSNSNSAWSSISAALRNLRQKQLVDFRREWKRRIYFKR